MRLSSPLLRSTPFRLAVTFAGLLICAFVLSGIVVYKAMDAELSDRLDEDMRKTFALLSAGYEQNDLEDVTTAVQSHADLSSDGEQLFALVSGDGTRLAGTLVLPQNPPQGFSTLTGDRVGRPEDEAYRVLSGTIGPCRLDIAFSYGETDELRSVVLSGFAWSTLIAAALAIAGGALLAARVQRRLDAIGRTMNEVSQGRLVARIPLIGNQDDIDAVSSQVNAALDRITALMEGLRQVGYDIAHDLRTPLNRIRIILETASAKPGADALSGDLDEALVELERTTQTFDALLRIAQIEAGARRQRFRSVDIASVIGDVHEAYAEVAVDAGKTLTLLPLRGGTVEGDRELLVQLAANLVENALTHTSAGTRISLGSKVSDSRTTITITDDGPGIPAEERDRVFRRLYRMDKSRSTPGSGLGLSMVKAIADLHGADVVPGDAQPGLIVSIRFPAS